MNGSKNSIKKLRKEVPNIVITGATGFLGSRLLEIVSAKRFLPPQYKIFVLTKETNNSFLRAIQKRIGANIKLIKYDLGLVDNNQKLPIQAKNADILIHLGGFVPKSGNPSDDSAEKSIKVNILGTQNLISQFRNLKKVIFASTLEVYGRPHYLPIDENHPTNPNSFYGASKLAAEKYLSVLAEQLGFKLVVLRFSSIYGPGEMYERAIPNFIKNAIQDLPPVIFGEGRDKRDYIYIDDAVRAIIQSFKSDVGGMFNISSGRPLSIKSVAELVIAISKKPLKPEYRSTSHPSKDLFFDIRKARKYLNFKPSVSLKRGLTQEYKWYAENL